MSITGNTVWFQLGILGAFFYAYEIFHSLGRKFSFFLDFDFKGVVEKCVGCFLQYQFKGSLFFIFLIKKVSRGEGSDFTMFPVLDCCKLQQSKHIVMVFNFSKKDSRLALSQDLKNGVYLRRFAEGVLFLWQLPENVLRLGLFLQQFCRLFQ